MQEIFSRTRRLIGETALNRLKNSTVAIFGIGGVGSYAAEALARGGIGHLVLVDNDKVSESNINRQLIALSDTVGMLKTEVMKKRILSINPAADVKVINGFYLPGNAADFFIEKYDYLVDAIDTVTAKVDLVLQAKEREIPIISCMGTGNKLDPLKFEVADIKKTSVCPLARVMRRELKKRGIEELKVVYSKEKPLEPESADDEDLRVPGSVSFVPSAAGLIIAGEVIKSLIGEIEK